jgi:DNA-binding Xre family transcriptional regulator
MARLTDDQLTALRAVPVMHASGMQNRLRIALALARARQSDILDAYPEMDAGQVSRIVNGKYASIELETTRKFAEFFGCQIEDLFPARDEVAS